jgi:long-chain fatty acid transport protein
VNDQLSIGATLNIMTGIFDTKLAINNLNPAYGDGQLKLQDNDIGWGANMGLMYQPNSATRIGVTYTSEVELQFNSGADFSGLGAAETALVSHLHTINMGITVPQTLNVSGFYQLNEKWALLGSLGWQDWSKFGYVDIDVNSASGTVNADFKDTYHAALGAQYRIDTPWLLNFGASYDSGFQDSNDATPMLPANAGWKIGTGLQNTSKENFEWGVSTEYQYGPGFNVNKTGGAPLRQGELRGSYQPNIFIIGANAIWKF